jgi:chemotaxis protein methyltransferase WspC
MMLSEFEALLKRTIGLDAATVGPSTVARAVQARMSACGLMDSNAYWRLVQTSQSELQELVEAVVIPETWFFRESKAFTAMARLAREEWLATHSQGVLRLLSMPCSTGEEPFSMAMALLDGRFPSDRFRIDAVDVSSRALAVAERGLYGKNSFRGTELDFRDLYFTPTGAAYQLHDAVRKNVHFKKGNMFDVDPLAGAEAFDIIFCRNILIYFDAITQERAIGLLSRLLAATGVLFVGPCEAGLLLRRDMISMKIPAAFAFRKATDSRPTPRCDIATKRQNEVRGTDAVQSEMRKPRAYPEAAAHRLPAPNQKLNIEGIRHLADRGNLAEAAVQCEEFLRQNGPSSEALHLLGLIRDAAGNLSEAAAYYRKALYLEPANQQALVHLALLREKQGDAASAKVLTDRARRAERQESK